MCFATPGLCAAGLSEILFFLSSSFVFFPKISRSVLCEGTKNINIARNMYRRKKFMGVLIGDEKVRTDGNALYS